MPDPKYTSNDWWFIGFCVLMILAVWVIMIVIAAEMVVKL